MTPGFSRVRRSGVAVASFTSFEADLLRSLAAQIVELLRSEVATSEPADDLERLLDFDGPTDVPEDPVLARLLPSAYLDDEESAADFRRYTESALRDAKAGFAACVIDTLEAAGLGGEPEDGVFIDVELDQSAALSWLRAFTDLRLALATRLGVSDDDEDHWDLPDDDPRSQVFEIYHWLGYLQETLVRAAS